LILEVLVHVFDQCPPALIVVDYTSQGVEEECAFEILILAASRSPHAAHDRRWFELWPVTIRVFQAVGTYILT
jgi:hypothetical protein